MIVVTDTSPLHYLVLLDADDLLQKLYGNVVCPETVLWECRHDRAPEKLWRWAAQPPAWLHGVADSPATLPGLAALDPRERAAIQTAWSLGARAVLMDERKGRQAAESPGLVAIGVVGVITEAARLKLTDFEATIRRLRSLTNFRVADAVIDRARAALAGK